MKKVICSRQVLPFKKLLKAMVTSSLVLALLLPLSAISATPDGSTSNNLEYIPETLSDTNNSESVIDQNEVEINDSTIESSKSRTSDDKTVVVPTDVVTNSDTPTAVDDDKSPTSAADAYLYQEKVETPPESQLKAAEKGSSWMNLEYLLGGGLLLLLGGGFLLLSKINKLKFENRELAHKNATLKANSDSQTKRLNNAKDENNQLRSDNINLEAALNEQHNSPDNVNTNASDLLSLPSLIAAEALVIEDLNKSDRSQLASIFENWLKTNRGNTKVDDLIPEDINKKLKHLHYTIELWGQGNGLDSVETTKNTMHTAVISLIRNDNKGYAYCYKKPNSMSSLWDNKAWYAVEKANGTIKLTGESLETN